MNEWSENKKYGDSAVEIAQEGMGPGGLVESSCSRRTLNLPRLSSRKVPGMILLDQANSPQSIGMVGGASSSIGKGNETPTIV